VRYGKLYHRQFLFILPVILSVFLLSGCFENLTKEQILKKINTANINKNINSYITDISKKVKKENPLHSIYCGITDKISSYDIFLKLNSHLKNINNIKSLNTASFNSKDITPKPGKILSFIKTEYKKNDGTNIIIYMVKIVPEFFDIKIHYGNNQGLTIDDIKKNTNIEVAVNGGFFEGNGSYLPIGLLLARGKKINPISSDWTHSGIFYITSVPGDLYGICNKDVFYDTDVTEAIQSYPILVWNGKPYVLNKDGEESSRSALAIDSDGNILIIATEPRLSGGISLYEFSRALCKLNFDCRKALNLDGGSSTQLYVKGRLSLYSNYGFIGEDKVSNFLIVKKK
jgi:exopolysaccharide biosynthesis protein